MFLIDMVGALLTVAALAFLGLAGYLAAVALRIGEDCEGRTDPLALAVASALLTLGFAVAIALLLGVCGLLRLEWALAAIAAVTVALLRWLSRRPDPWGPALAVGEATWRRLREHPFLALIVMHAAGSELLRGLLRPPLSWDSLVYHLWLAAEWFQTGEVAPALGPRVLNFFGMQPANGSLWLWWWIAPSHSELYVNLASALPWLLLALASGAVARELGARRSWPLAAGVIAVTPMIVRFIGAQYADLMVAATLVGAVYFSLRWLANARRVDAVLAGLGLGLATGAKALALAYVGAWVLAVFAALAVGAGHRRGRWQGMLLAATLIAALGGFWLVRNVAVGAGPLGERCEPHKVGAAPGTVPGLLPTLPVPDSVLGRFDEVLAHGELVDALLGMPLPATRELGIGPQVVLFVPMLLLPWLLPAAVRRASWLVWSQIVAQALFWLAVPVSSFGWIFASPRFLGGAVALAVAAGVAVLETRGVKPRLLELLAAALALQSLLQLHAEMPRGVRIIMALCDGLALFAIAAPPAWRARVGTHRRLLFAVAALVGIVLVPPFAAFRIADRGRAMAQEETVHAAPLARYAAAWTWLDRFAGDGTVAVVGWPRTMWIYPAMGPRLERRALYVNVNERDGAHAAVYPGCDPRVDPSPEAWRANLAKHEVRFLLVTRPGEDGWPDEVSWAEAEPARFVVRYADPGCRLYELIEDAASAASATPKPSS